MTRENSLNPKQSSDFTLINSAEPNGDGLLQLPLLVLDNQVVFPQVLSLVPVNTEANFQAISYAKEHKQTLIVVKQRHALNGGQLAEHIHDIGTEIAPGQLSDAYGDKVHVLVQGRRRVRILDVDEEASFSRRARPHDGRTANQVGTCRFALRVAAGAIQAFQPLYRVCPGQRD